MDRQQVAAAVSRNDSASQASSSEICNHNLLQDVEGPVDAQALWCVVEAIVEELEALAGTLHGSEVGTDSKAPCMLCVRCCRFTILRV